MSSGALPPAVKQAIEWVALQRSGHMSEADQQHFQQWLLHSEANRDAWHRLEQRLGTIFTDLPEVSHQVLSNAGSSRRHLLRGALAVTGIGLGGWWLQRAGLLPGMGSDLQSGFAERRPFALEDGSRVVLNAQSRVDLALSARERRLILREGALSVQVAADPLRPLIVQTTFGEIRALGTRFSVTQREQNVHVWVQESRVLLTAPGGARLELAAAQGALLDHSGVRQLDPRQAGEGVWEDGLLEVHDQPLGEIIEALRPYRRGVLRISSDAAALRVSGVFPLDNSDQALRSLQEVLPIKVEQHFKWWTQLSLR
ncbi:FecR domain-containing protein [Pseudomonas viridiflava]|uniref:FecR domain-containing protein n=1 Tax=Pseudomonas viridiflava TaxID=33069 RepID=UPI000F04A19E|nr:FecR family protein [Pseudomonas viridiflava]